MKLIAKFTRTRTATKTVAWKYKTIPPSGTAIANGYYARLTYDKDELVKEIAFNFDGQLKDINAGTLERIIDKCGNLVEKSASSNHAPQSLPSYNPVKMLPMDKYASCKY